MCLAVRQVYGDDGFVGKGGSKRGEVMCSDIVVGDDADLPLRDDRGEQVSIVQETVADMDGVAARSAGRQVDGEGVHRAPVVLVVR